MYSQIPIIYRIDPLTFCPRKGFGCIYLYIVDTGQEYVGQTVGNLRIRHNAHVSRGKHTTNFIDNVLHCGNHEYVLYVIDTAPVESLDELEIFFIAYRNTLYPNGYNLTTGGSALKKHSDRTRRLLSESRIKWAQDHYDYYKDFRALMNDPQYLRPMHTVAYHRPKSEEHKRKIKESLNKPEVKALMRENTKSRWENEDYRKKMSTVNNRKIRKYNLQGEFLEEYDSIVEACVKSGIPKQNATHISRCARGHKKSAHGFIWKYAEE